MALRAARETEERKGIIAELTAGLGHTPNRAEQLLIEAAAAQAVEGAKLRRRGKSSADADRLLLRAIATLHRLAPAATPPGASVDDIFADIAAEQAAKAAPQVAPPTRGTNPPPTPRKRTHGGTPGAGGARARHT